MEEEDIKHCPDCGQDKPRSEFYNRAASKDGKCYQCKVCFDEAWKKSVDANRDAYRERKRNWIRANRDKCPSQAASVTSEYRKQWRAVPGNAASVQAYGQVRRARKKGASINEPVNREHLANMYDWMCQIEVCLHPDGRAIDPTLTYIDPATGKPNPWYLSVDHDVQIGEGGDNSYENTRPSHLRCNLSRPRGPRKNMIDPLDDSCNNDSHD